MANRFTQAAREASDVTNKQLGEKIATLSSFNKNELNELLPTKKDKEAFLRLMEQVEADTELDEKLAFLTENIQTAGKVVFQILKKLI